MTLASFLTASTEIQIHISAALIGLCLGPVIICARARGRAHKMMGYIWVVALAITALSSFAIQEIRLFGSFSPLHGLSLLTLWTLVMSIRAARQKRITAHRAGLVSLYVSLLVAGAFTLLPGRRMADTFAPDLGWTGFAIGVAVALGLGLVIRRALSQRHPALSRHAA